MNYPKHLLIIILGITVFLLSCGSKSPSPSTSNTGKPSAISGTKSADPAGKETDSESEPYSDILEKDIFTPPDMRSSMKTPMPVVENIIEPQKLTITGIVFDGTQYLVSVENFETGESNYLKVNDQLIDYSITTIDFDKVIAKKKKDSKTYQVGDQIPIPGTGTQRVKESVISEDTTHRILTVSQSENPERTDLDNPNINTETASGLPPAGDSLEERLRKRRQQQEEELK
jgi:hypothetical protein